MTDPMESVHLVDQPRIPRKGEDLDEKSLRDYLEKKLPDLTGEMEVLQFREGYSNLTYVLRFPEREIVLRRPPFGNKVKSAHDMGREYRVLSAIHGVYRPAPKPLLYCEDETVIGSPFFLMERVEGAILRSRAPLDFNPTAAVVRRCCEAFIDNLAALHRLDYREVGLSDLRKPGNYADRQVEGWARRYYAAHTDHIPNIESTIVWLKNRVPEDTDAVIVHNDYKFDNVVLDPEDLTRVLAVLDWEMATIGDPLMDLGNTLAYWSEGPDLLDLQNVRCFLTLFPGALKRQELAERYAEVSGRDLGDLLFYYVFGLFRLAVIAQQIYTRYARGVTKDERFSRMIDLVYKLGQSCIRAIETRRVSAP